LLQYAAKVLQVIIASIVDTLQITGNILKERSWRVQGLDDSFVTCNKTIG